MSATKQDTTSSAKRKREDDEEMVFLESPTKKKAKTSEEKICTATETDPAPTARAVDMDIDTSSTGVTSTSRYDAKLIKVFPSLLFAEKNSDAYFPVTTDNPLFLVLPYIEDLKFLLLTLGSVSKQTRALVFLPGPAWTKTFRRIFGSDNFDPDAIEFSSDFKKYKKEFEADTKAPLEYDDTTNIPPATYLDRMSVFKSKDWSFEEFDGCPLWESDGWVDFHIDFFGDAFWYAHAYGCGRGGEYNATNDFFGEGRLIVRKKAWLQGVEKIYFDEEPRSDYEEDDDDDDDDSDNSDKEDDEEKVTKEEKEPPVSLKKEQSEEEKQKLALMTPKERCIYERFGGQLPSKADDTETGIYLVSPLSKEIQGGRLIYDLSSNMEW